MLFDDEPLFTQLESEGLGAWAQTLRQRAHDAQNSSAHGHRDQWDSTIAALPIVNDYERDWKQ